MGKTLYKTLQHVKVNARKIKGKMTNLSIQISLNKMHL